MNEWQPIETAPKDGTVLLLYSDNVFLRADIFVGYYKSDNRAGPRPHGDFVWHLCDDGEAVAEDLVTHWMPLPEPPK